MKVLRIVADLAVADPGAAKAFYRDLFGLDLLMDLGWIVTMGARQRAPAQLSFMTEGGSGAPVPQLSIEVDSLDVVLERVRRRKVPIVYGPVVEPWGVRRFFVRDPAGTLINVLAHDGG
jgi:catechol 2,3-dioxygenase-like lactoylglutathione lyase family enzyme